MAEEVIDDVEWTDSAKISFNKVVEYLREKWTEREVERFVSRTAEMLATLKRYPEMCRPSSRRKNVRIGILNKHTQLVYHYKPRSKRLQVILFWHPKQNPAKFKY